MVKPLTKSEKLKASWTKKRRRVWARRMSVWKTRHRMSRTPEHNAWLNMRGRCRNPKREDYKLYGGRGIKVHSLWDRSFEAFYAHVGPRPKGTSLDRIDNSRGYVPGNVRWATKIQQARNKRNTTMVVFKGRKRVLRDLAEEHGIGVDTLRARLKKMSLKEALTRPLQAGKAWR